MNKAFITTLAVIVLAATSQTFVAQEKKPSRRDIDPDTLPIKTFNLHNNRMNDANEILTALRNIESPVVKIFLVPSQNAIVVRGTPEEIAVAEKLIAELDRPRRSIRVTYTITETENGKRKGAESSSVVVAAGERTMVKNGSRVPVMVSMPPKADGAQNMTYLDVGWNTDTTVDDLNGTLRLRAKVERSSVAEDRNPANGAQDPVIRQSVLDGTLILVPGKTMQFGSIDSPGSPRHFDVDVTATVLP